MWHLYDVMRTRGFMGVGYGSICSVGDNNRVVDLYGVFVMMVGTW